MMIGVKGIILWEKRWKEAGLGGELDGRKVRMGTCTGKSTNMETNSEKDAR